MIFSSDALSSVPFSATPDIGLAGPWRIEAVGLFVGGATAANTFIGGPVATGLYIGQCEAACTFVGGSQGGGIFVGGAEQAVAPDL